MNPMNPELTSYDQITNLACSIKKPTKKGAFKIVQTLVVNQTLTVEQQAELYAFFLPGLPAKPKTPDQWVAKAAGKYDVRDYLNYVYSDGSRLMASDGHVLHILNDCNNFSAGYYDSKLDPVPQFNMKYPDIDRLIPSRARAREVSVASFRHLENRCHLTAKDPVQVLINDNWFPKHQIMTAISLFDEILPVEIRQDDSMKPLLLQQGNFQAVIMPCLNR